LNLENYFISLFNNKHIGDDAALIEGVAYSMDAFFENVHFKTKWISYYQIARKAMLVNISDAIAMNAKPQYAILSIAMPKTISKSQMQELAKGFRDTADEYGVEIIGGDTISNTKLDISVTIVSKTNKPLKRSGLREGYLLAYTGKLGDSKKDLRKLMNLGSIHRNSKFVNIKLKKNFIKNAQRFLSSGMDISDGLFTDLDKLASLNKVGFNFHHKIPKSIGCSGEEYEMLVAFSKRDKKTVLRRATQSRTKLTIFASSARKKYTNRCKSHHF
jgi:thiamine-monophosphate kinase